MDINIMDTSTNITTVLEKYHERMAREAQLMESLPREQVVQRRDEFMLSVGRSKLFEMKKSV